LDNEETKDMDGKGTTHRWNLYDDVTYASKPRFLGFEEYYAGRLGPYFPNSGYFVEFLPYDQTKQEFDEIIDEMAPSWLEIGPTKMVAIEFAQIIPATNYFTTVLMLFEFTALGQVIPSRLEIMPYKLSPFSSFKEDVTSTLDLLKVFLNLYNVYSVIERYGVLKQIKIDLLYSKDLDPDELKKKVKEDFTVLKHPMVFVSLWLGTVMESQIDIMIIVLQNLAFLIKLADAIDFNINPYEVLDDKYRLKFISIYFFSENFRNF
jgi:hypothetical protein